MSIRRAAAPALLAALFALVPARPGAPQPAGAAPRLSVVEVARSVDLSRGKQEFLTVVVEVAGLPPARLRRVQPLREEFRLLAGGTRLPCRWLRGGSLPDDPGRLRFTLGFSLPPAGVRRVTLEASTPRGEGEAPLELRLTRLQTGKAEQTRQGPGWTVKVHSFGEQEYTVPALPPKGRFFSKGGPVDFRVYRAAGSASPAPERAIVLSLSSRDVELFDRTLDVSGTLLVEGGPAVPLLSASMRRDPAHSVKNPPYPPFLSADLHYQVPRTGRAAGAVILLHRRPRGDGSRLIRFPDLPVPGR